MAYENIELDVSPEGTAVVLLNRPQKRNAFNAEVIEELTDAFETLSKTATTVRAKYADRAEADIWYGIIVASYAGAKGGVGALALVKDAKAALEHAIASDPKALAGSAYTSLGSLYYQVPGWPIGFGDDKKARELLETALKLNPDGIDPNYFYGEYQCAKCLRSHGVPLSEVRIGVAGSAARGMPRRA